MADDAQIESYTDQLVRVQSLIRDIESSPNKSTTVLGRQFTKHDLPDLWEREADLRVKASREKSGGGVVIKQVVPL